MKKIMLILLAGSFIFTSCGGGDDKDGDGKSMSCSEKNEAKAIVLTEHPELSADQFTHAKAWRAGWSMSGGKHRLNVYVAFSNQEIEMSSYGGANPPKDDNGYQIHVSFNGPMSDKEDEYPEVEAGKFEPGSSFSDNPCVAIVIYNKGMGLNAFNVPDAIEGTAEITNLSEN